ncbi:MAG: TraB domain-containing protein [Candidatus Aenigmatarchaeota archaeon]
MAKIILVPTSHIASESVKKVESVIEKEEPDCVAVELDINRFFAQRKGEGASDSEVLKNIGFSSFLVYWTMKKLQNWLGKKTGILPGSEMMQAVKIAEKKKLTIAFIDRDIRQTFLRIQKITTGEKLKLFWFLIKGIVIGSVWSKLSRQKIDLSKLPPKDMIDDAMSILREEFPQLYKVLLTERNIFMVKKLEDLSTKFKKIVVVIGAGHYDGMKKLIDIM